MMRNPVLDLAITSLLWHMRLTAHDDRDNMLGSIEEKELGHDKCLDQHNRARRHHTQQSNDVHDPHDIEHDVTSAE